MSYPRTMRSISDRLWEKVDRSGGPDACWPFLGSLDGTGYGQIGVGRAGDGQRQAHVVAYELTVGPIPPGKELCHSCDVRYPVGDITYRRCCNPAHVHPGTHAENMAEMAAKGRIPSGDRHWSREKPALMARGSRAGRNTHPEKYGCGEAHPMAKITKAQAVDVLRRIAAGEKQRDIARDLGIGEPEVTRIKQGVRWRGVGDSMDDQGG